MLQQPPVKDMANEQFSNVKDCKQVSWMLKMASIMDSTVGPLLLYFP